MNPFAENVARGVALLDKHFGSPTWRKKCEGMRIRDYNDCILWRLFGGYVEGLEILDLPSGVHYGFDVMWVNRDNYDQLQKAWDDEFANPPLGTDD